MRPRSPFSGEYELFSTSELLYFAKQAGGLHVGKECALLHRRTNFRSDWRAMQAASYLATLFSRSTPEEAPHPELFALYEELLDLTAEYGRHPQFLPWAELRFCEHHGHAPNLGSCTLCRTTEQLRFCAAQGGVVCRECVDAHELATIECPPDTLALLRNLQKADHPQTAVDMPLSSKKSNTIHAMLSAFMIHHFNLQPIHRLAALAAA
jgi:DNA repair protein RecO